MSQLRSQSEEFTSVEPIAMRQEIARRESTFDHSIAGNSIFTSDRSGFSLRPFDLILESSFGCIIALECSVMDVGINLTKLIERIVTETDAYAEGSDPQDLELCHKAVSRWHVPITLRSSSPDISTTSGYAIGLISRCALS
ncbi:hypothetical protein G5I_14272 [Acromyrmex echinatior]|uniref:Uncharacterized protein n=1 Tax=Acromyrmex echinatior TaxID=103372 RepID=F4X7D2_ACREC|nr:hypothetical protein G5I_14272 [Acromyrmex echinatior]